MLDYEGKLREGGKGQRRGKGDQRERRGGQVNGERCEGG